VTKTLVRCAKCGRPWFDPAERRFADLMVGDEDNEEQLQTNVWCPACAAGEFGA
jgi:hypothetical protein